MHYYGRLALKNIVHVENDKSRIPFVQNELKFPLIECNTVLKFHDILIDLIYIPVCFIVRNRRMKNGSRCSLTRLKSKD